MATTPQINVEGTPAREEPVGEPSKEAQAGEAAETTVTPRFAARRDAAARRDVLVKVWAGASFIGCLVAIGLGWLGQQAVLAGDSDTAFRYYLFACILIIVSLLRPSVRPLRELSASGQAFRSWVSAPKAPALRARWSKAGEKARESLLRLANYLDLASPRATTSPANAALAVAPQASTPLAGRAVRARQGASTDKDAATAPQPPVVQSTWKARLNDYNPHLWARWKWMRARLGWRFTLPAALLTGFFTLMGWQVLNRTIGSPFGGWSWSLALISLLVTVLGLPSPAEREPAMVTWDSDAPAGDDKSPGAVASRLRDFFSRGVPQPPLKWEALMVAGVIILALVLRLINLEYMPGIFGDEGERGMEARAINEGAPHVLWAYGWWGVPNLYFYLVSFMLRIFGDTMVGDRMLSVISGVVSVWFIYKIGRLLWGPRVGIIAGVLLAVSPLALQFSRVAGESTPTGALWTIGFYFLFMALRYRRWSDWALAGIAWSFSLYFYAAGKLIIAVGVGVLLYCLVRFHVNFFRRYLLGFALLTFAFLLTFMPYAIFTMQENPPWQSFTGRAQETSLLYAPNQPSAFQRYGIPYTPPKPGESIVSQVLSNPGPWATLIFNQLRGTTEVLYKSGDPTPMYQIQEHNGSMLAPLWAVLALLGLAYGAWKLWDPRFGLIDIWFWGGMLGPALTTDAFPSVQRLVGAWPVLMLFPAVLLDRVFATLWPLNLRLSRQWATVPLAGLVIFFGTDSYREYFGHYASLCPYCDPTTQARYAQSLGQEYKAYEMGVGSYDVFFGYGSTRFAAKGVEGVDLAAPSDFFPIIDNNGKGAAFIVRQPNQQYLPMLRLLYPGGQEEPIKGADGQTYFTSYKITAEQFAAFQTVHATYVGLDGKQVTRDEPNVGNAPAPKKQGVGNVPVTWSLPAGVTYPVSATWQGGLVAPTYGAYTFFLQGPAGAGLQIDGKQVLSIGQQGKQAQADLVLARGVHDVMVMGTLQNAGTRIEVRWSFNGASPSLIEARYLYNGTTGGLSGEVAQTNDLGVVKADDPLKGLARTARRSDQFIGFREATVTLGSAPFIARWQGTVRADTDGSYSFDTSSNGPSALYIDGQLVVDNASSAAIAQASGTIHLTRGEHRIDLRYAWQPGGPHAEMEWYWTPPGSERTLVPPTALRPLARSWSPKELTDAPAAQAPQPPPEQTVQLKPDVVFQGDISNARGIGVDNEGYVYVGDRGHNRVVVFSPDGKIARTWGKAPDKGQESNPKPDEFVDIVDLAVTGDGKVYVMDLKANRLQVFDKTGKLLKVVGADTLSTSVPNGVALGPDGTFYIADTSMSHIVVVPPISGAQSNIAAITTITGKDTGKLEQPVDVVPDPSTPGRVYVADLKNRIARLDADGTVTSYAVQVGTDEGGSRLAISPDGSEVYMSDPDRQRVAVLNLVDGSITYFGSNGTDPGQFTRPSGIAVGPDGRLYVLDRSNNNVQVFTLAK